MIVCQCYWKRNNSSISIAFFDRNVYFYTQWFGLIFLYSLVNGVFLFIVPRAYIIRLSAVTLYCKQFDTKRRKWEEVKKKYYNVKSRSKCIIIYLCVFNGEYMIIVSF